MLLQACESGMYCWDTVSISPMSRSVSSTFLRILEASRFSVSREAITESSSKIFPLASLSAYNRDFSSCRRSKWYSPEKIYNGLKTLLFRCFRHFKNYTPCSLRSERFSSMSGRSALRTEFRHWLWSEERVTVKLTNDTPHTAQI